MVGAKKILPAPALEEFAKEISTPGETKISLTAFESALARLREVLTYPKTEVVRDAAIQRFEFTFELAWKTAMRVAQKEGVECAPSPRQVIKAALKQGWIADDKLWLKMLEDRNRTTHIYNEGLPEEIFAHLPGYQTALSGLHDCLKQILESPEDEGGESDGGNSE